MTVSQLGPVDLAALQAPVQGRLIKVDGEMQRMLEEDFPLVADVNRHLLRMRGKMFRPTLALLADEATGNLSPDVEALAAVLELVHLATLVHDDAVDHSTLRRGMPTINAEFSHQIAVIMGDFLYSRAMIELVRLANLDAMAVVARVTNEMTIGEMRQLLSHDPLSFTEHDYDLLITAKTASLMSGACSVGALGAPPLLRSALERFGILLGMAFQIVDDLLDYTADTVTTGKPSGLDLREHKVTLPLIHAMPLMTAAERSTVAGLMASPEPTDEQIAEVVAAVERHGGLRYATERAERLVEQADRELGVLPDSPARETLRQSLAYVLERRH